MRQRSRKREREREEDTREEREGGRQAEIQIRPPGQMM